MKLLRMTATFGRLDHETLTLTDGLSLLQLPNEAGKSTWAEFLLAMFYGIDTSEREKTGVLPVKTKYQPWNGKAMVGTIELEQDGRRITLTRKLQFLHVKFLLNLPMGNVMIQCSGIIFYTIAALLKLVCKNRKTFHHPLTNFIDCLNGFRIHSAIQTYPFFFPSTPSPDTHRHYIFLQKIHFLCT